MKKFKIMDKVRDAMEISKIILHINELDKTRFTIDVQLGDHSFIYGIYKHTGGFLEVVYDTLYITTSKSYEEVLKFTGGTDELSNEDKNPGSSGYLFC